MDGVIRDYVTRELVQDPAVLPLTNTTPLLESGILDSLGLLTLVVFIQEQFGIEVDYVDIIPENFASVDAICAYLSSRTATQASGAIDQS
jgi:acyl carrier protein